MSPRVILASASPRRRELLSLIGLEHEVRPADVDETLVAGESPRAYADRLARAKALAAASPDVVAIGCDTIVVVDGDVLGKPRDAADATRMLRLLSGRQHLVMTAVAVAFDGRIVSDVVQVGVTFRSLSPPRSPTTSAPASRWTRRAPTASRAMARRSSTAWTATTSRSWGFR